VSSKNHLRFLGDVAAVVSLSPFASSSSEWFGQSQSIDVTVQILDTPTYGPVWNQIYTLIAWTVRNCRYKSGSRTCFGGAWIYKTVRIGSQPSVTLLVGRIA
jgi:hypothetical protein